MSDFFNRGVLDNPLNIKRLTGDIPTSKSSSKHLTILIVVLFVCAYTFPRVWAITLALLKYPSIAVITLVIIYGIGIFKLLSITVFEEKRQKEAYLDLLENKITNLSTIWEIQDVKTTVVGGKEYAYIDYINGRRSMFIKCVPGSVMNLPDSAPVVHYTVLQEVIEAIQKKGYEVDIHVNDESFVDHKALSYYYSKLRNFADKEYINVVAEQLDLIAKVSAITSSIHVTYLEISGYSNKKHNMVKELSGITSLLYGGTIYKEVRFLSSKHEIDNWIANDASVPQFDRELLILDKYKNTVSTGSTAVLTAHDSEGNIIRQFNPDFDHTKLVKLKSISVNTRAKTLKEAEGESTDVSVAISIPIPLTEEEVYEVSPVLLSQLDNTKDAKYLQLMYSNKKVKLGD